MKPKTNQTEIYNDKDHYLKEELETIEECLKIYLMLWELQISNSYEKIGFDVLAKKMLHDKKQEIEEALSTIKNSLCDGRCINE
tara:strand:+ start:269 stop:520 length:252 start_codon:yes stop_codon:yes gene_type:complete